MKIVEAVFLGLFLAAAGCLFMVIFIIFLPKHLTKLYTSTEVEQAYKLGFESGESNGYTQATVDIANAMSTINKWGCKQ